MLNNLFGDSVDEFLGKTDEMFNKIEDWKDKKVGYFANDEKSEYEVVGETANVPNINEEVRG